MTSVRQSKRALSANLTQLRERGLTVLGGRYHAAITGGATPDLHITGTVLIVLQATDPRTSTTRWSVPRATAPGQAP
ncbi:hypothetical protein SAMN05216174_113128 [Actinokineospora iranica]|uniref:Uncharacterized protein n=1 Tax=Actinokineospora iranica TaxID=1271860 RepID=A0A1G6VWJ2_9PSEU|nr:hypothetical protein SAMN05216174_113128 [Actinokineospora iranica]